MCCLRCLSTLLRIVKRLVMFLFIGDRSKLVCFMCSCQSGVRYTKLEQQGEDLLFVAGEEGSWLMAAEMKSAGGFRKWPRLHASMFEADRYYQVMSGLPQTCVFDEV